MQPINGATRHCSQCDREVHDLGRLSLAEALALLDKQDEARICVRYRADARGHIQFADSERQTSSLRWPTLAEVTNFGLLGFGLLGLGLFGCTAPELGRSVAASDVSLEIAEHAEPAPTDASTEPVATDGSTTPELDPVPCEADLVEGAESQDLDEPRVYMGDIEIKPVGFLDVRPLYDSPKEYRRERRSARRAARR
jgi:hypothetical protein